MGRRGWSSHVEDAAALAALVLGQALVHGAIGSPGTQVTVGSSAHHHAPGSEHALAAAQSPAVHAGSGMAVGHALAVTAASSPASPTMELHEVVEADGTMVMQPVEGGFEVPPVVRWPWSPAATT